MAETSTAPVKTGQGVRALIERRQQDLKAVLLRTDDKSRADINAALGAVNGMLTGDLDRITDVQARQLVGWLEHNKYLGAKEIRELAAEKAGAR